MALLLTAADRWEVVFVELSEVAFRDSLCRERKKIVCVIYSKLVWGFAAEP